LFLYLKGAGAKAPKYASQSVPEKLVWKLVSIRWSCEAWYLCVGGLLVWTGRTGKFVWKTWVL